MSEFEHRFKNIKLEKNNIQLVPLSYEHESGLALAVQDGELWNLTVTSTPHYSQVREYIQTAFQQKAQGSRFPFVILNTENQQILGTSSFHDILWHVDRYDIGYTWYAKSVQRTHVNTTCKFLLLQFAFEVLNANTVGFITDIFNFNSQKAIERLGAKKDGIIRGDALRKDGTIRDTVKYSIVRGEWIGVKAHLENLLRQHAIHSN